MMIKDGRDYLQAWKNVINSMMNVIYLASFFLKYYTMLQVRLSKQRINTAQFWNNLNDNQNITDAVEKDFFTTMYWLNAGNTHFKSCVYVLGFLKEKLSSKVINSFI